MSADEEDEPELPLEEQEGYVGEAISFTLTFAYHGVLDGGAGDSEQLSDEIDRLRRLVCVLVKDKLKPDLAESWSVKTTVQSMYG